MDCKNIKIRRVAYFCLQSKDKVVLLCSSFDIFDLSVSIVLNSRWPHYCRRLELIELATGTQNTKERPLKARVRL